MATTTYIQENPVLSFIGVLALIAFIMWIAKVGPFAVAPGTIGYTDTGVGGSGGTGGTGTGGGTGGTGTGGTL